MGEERLAADCRQPSLLRPSGSRPQLKAGVAMTSEVKSGQQLFLGLHDVFLTFVHQKSRSQ